MSGKKLFKLKKIDILIVVILIVSSGIVLFKAGYIYQPSEEKIPPSEREKQTQIKESPEKPLIPPASITPGYMRAVSPGDEGLHYDKINVCREWWYFTVVFDKNSELPGWVATVSFNHMARGDLLGTAKPDLLVVALHGPNGEEYGGMINKERGLGILKQPTLQAKTPGVSVTYDDSWAEGEAPEWVVHAEDDDIDLNHDLIIDLHYFAPYDPIWTIGDRALQKTKSNLASYVFLGCNVTGTVEIDGKTYKVHGLGFHEHSWSPNIVTRGLINGWDWSQITLDNGWNIYYSNYYPTPQYISTKLSKKDVFGSLILTTDQGKSLTIFDNTISDITKSNEETFPFVTMPIKIHITGKPGLLQPLLSTYDISLDLNINIDNTYEKIWKFPTYVGMNVGRCSIDGTITWTDENGEHNIDIQGIGTIWNMRAFI